MIDPQHKKDSLKKSSKVQLSDDTATLKAFSHDASLFEITPSLVAHPKNIQEIKQLVSFVAAHKKDQPDLSLTVRSGGTDMSGGAINTSIIVDMAKHLGVIGPIDTKKQTVHVQPGAFYRNFETKTMRHSLLLPSYPASKELCTLGGMVANNSGGEKSLVYGKTDSYVRSLNVVLSDGKEYTFRPLKGAQLKAKLKSNDLSGQLHRKVYSLVSKNQKLISQSRPKVSKNSTGYNVWDVWDGETLDLTKLFVGSQGTLGIITKAELSLVKAKPLSGMLVLFMPSFNNLGSIVTSLMSLKPTSLESFDEHTLKFAMRFFLTFRKTLGLKRFVLLGISFLPLLNRLLKRFPKLPKLIVLVEFEGDSQKEIDDKIAHAREIVDNYDVETHIAKDKQHEEKFWVMRRESFNLLRKNVKERHTAPFIDDVVVPYEHVEKFFPELVRILEKHKLLYTIAGHVGDGNFHIIPLMDFNNPKEMKIIPKCLRDVTELVLKYEGSLSGEHNDGLVRGPFLKDVFSSNMLQVQKEIKKIFDPQNIFNPHKKTDASWKFSEKHIRKSFE